MSSFHHCTVQSALPFALFSSQITSTWSGDIERVRACARPDRSFRHSSELRNLRSLTLPDCSRAPPVEQQCRIFGEHGGKIRGPPVLGGENQTAPPDFTESIVDAPNACPGISIAVGSKSAPSGEASRTPLPNPRMQTVSNGGLPMLRHPNETIPGPVGNEPTIEERWARWVAKGAAHDRRKNARLRYVAMVVAAGLLAWLALVLMTR